MPAHTPKAKQELADGQKREVFIDRQLFGNKANLTTPALKFLPQ